MVEARPDKEPAVALRGPPPPRPRRPLVAVRRLEVVVVHHSPTSSGFGDEAGGDVAGLGHGGLHLADGIGGRVSPNAGSVALFVSCRPRLESGIRTAKTSVGH